MADKKRSEKSSSSSSKSAVTSPAPYKVKEIAVKVSKAPNEALALTNNVFLHPDDAKALESGTGPAYVEVTSSTSPPKTFIYNFQCVLLIMNNVD